MSHLKYEQYLSEEIITNGCSPQQAHKRALERVFGYYENLDKQNGHHKRRACDECEDETGTRCIVDRLKGNYLK